MSTGGFFFKSGLCRAPFKLRQDVIKPDARKSKNYKKMIEQIGAFRNNALRVAGDGGDNGFNRLFAKLLARFSNALGIEAGGIGLGIR